MGGSLALPEQIGQNVIFCGGLLHGGHGISPPRHLKNDYFKGCTTDGPPQGAGLAHPAWQEKITLTTFVLLN
jgi:hypothetical protein